MSFKENASSAGGIVFGAILLLCILMVPVAFIFGAAELSIWALTWLPNAFSWTLVATLALFVPLAFITPARSFAGNGILIASYIFGAILWIWALAITYTIWGIFALIVGLAFLGVGVVPIAMLAAIFEAEWAVLANLAFLFILTFASRGLGNWLLEKAVLRRVLLDDEEENRAIAVTTQDSRYNRVLFGETWRIIPTVPDIEKIAPFWQGVLDGYVASAYRNVKTMAERRAIDTGLEYPLAFALADLATGEVRFVAAVEVCQSIDSCVLGAFLQSGIHLNFGKWDISLDEQTFIERAKAIAIAQLNNSE